MRLISSLTNRIFLAMTLLALVPIGVAIVVVTATVTAQAEAELERGLEEAGRLVDQYHAMLFQHVAREAHLIADLPKLKAAVETDHEPTVRPLAADYRERIQADLFLVTNRDGRALAGVGGSGLTPAAIRELPAVRAALEGRETASFWSHDGGILQVVTVPVWIDLEHPEMLGSLSVGFSLNEPLARRFRDLTNSDIAFAHAGSIQAATLPTVGWPLVAELLAKAGPSRVTLAGDDLVALARPLGHLPTAAEVRPDTADQPIAVILRSRTERLRFLGALHTALAVTALVAVLAAILLSYVVSRTITRPLAAITAAMRETAATGDLTRGIRLPGRVWMDEDARLLATTFNTMTGSIARFQREAAERERLSSLGRLSTVIAHEIRNPLMIIKAALRPLRRDDAGAERVRRAAADIEEEVARLNRLVTEVLDFARPIRFELAPADLNAVCRDAASAVSASTASPAIAVALDPAIGQVVTDAERLRLVLVNVLANACQAVAGVEAPEAAVAALALDRHDRAPADAGTSRAAIVELTTRRLGADRVAITVRDRGPGIAAADLPHIFEPFFTTRRTGSGLGLAIAKNIVEGLGGAIAIDSHPDRGTEVQIALPRESPRPDAEA